MDLIRFQPIYQERVWGGRGLQSKLGRVLPEDKVIGESWEVVDRPEACSVVSGGSFEGKSLRELILSDGADIMGPDYPAEKPFPVLVKWLDCQQRLSLQVHPPADIASDLGGESKTENWYIAAAESGAAILAGLKAGVTREQFESALEDDTLEPLVHRIPVQPGDSMFVPSGRIHAIDAGNLILEVQENSDTTYRVYDWGRVGLDGKPRQLHVEQSLRSIDFGDFEPPVLHNADLLADCDEFRLRRIVLNTGAEPLTFNSGEQPRLFHVVSGRLRESRTGETLTGGDNVLLPFAGGFVFEALEDTVALVTDNFA